MTPDFSYVDKGKRARAIKRAIDIFFNRNRMKPDEWGQANRIYPQHTGVPGPRNPWLTPYMIPWTRALAESGYARVVVVCGAQMGKTDGMLDVIGERMDNQPVPIIYVGPSKEYCIDQFEPRLMSLFDESQKLGAKVLRGKLMKKIKKLVSGVPIRLAHAGSATALKSDPAAVALVDEYDGMVQNIGKQGDPLGLVEARGFTYADFVTGISSTPTVGNVECEERPDPESGLIFWKHSEPEDVWSPIWKLFQEGTRYHWCWRCPHCEDYFVPRMSCLRWQEPESDKQKRQAAAIAKKTAFMECPRCGGVITEAEKPKLNASGRMVAPGQVIDDSGEVTGEPPESSTASFWVSGLCSPFKSFGDRASALVAAHQTGEGEKIKTVVNSNFGECYVGVAGDAPEWTMVKSHAGIHLRGTVPSEVVYLVMTCDVQKNRIVWLVRGWGPRGTSWLIDYGEIWGETVEEGVWNDLARMIREPIDGMDLKLVLIDSGFRPGKRDDLPLNRVYDFCRRFPALVRPTKGSSTPMRTPIVKAKQEVNRKGSASRFGLELIRLDTDRWKSFVHEKVKWPDEQPGAWHLFQEIDDDYCKQIVSESRVTMDSGNIQWVRKSKQNHFLDCEAMQGAASYLLNAQRLVEGRAADRAPKQAPQEAAAPVTQLVTVSTQKILNKKRPGIAGLLPK